MSSKNLLKQVSDIRSEIKMLRQRRQETSKRLGRLLRLEAATWRRYGDALDEEQDKEEKDLDEEPLTESESRSPSPAPLSPSKGIPDSEKTRKAVQVKDLIGRCATRAMLQEQENRNQEEEGNVSNEQEQGRKGKHIRRSIGEDSEDSAVIEVQEMRESKRLRANNEVEEDLTYHVPPT